MHIVVVRLIRVELKCSDFRAVDEDGGVFVLRVALPGVRGQGHGEQHTFGRREARPRERVQDGQVRLGYRLAPWPSVSRGSAQACAQEETGEQGA